jgi:hypothetical protein
MAKKALVFSVPEWASLDEAFVVAKAAFGSSKHALQDLHDHMRSRRLPSAVRRLEPDGTAVFEPLEPSFWETVTLRESFGPGPDGVRRSGTVRVHDRKEPLYSHGADRLYFVARPRLTKLYTTEVQTNDAPSAPAPEPAPEPEPKPAGSGRGRRPVLSDKLKQRGINLVRARLAKATTELTNKDAIKLLRTKLKLPDTVDDDRLNRRLLEDIIRPARKPANK